MTVTLPAFTVNHYSAFYPYLACPTDRCNPEGKCSCDRTVAIPVTLTGPMPLSNRGVEDDLISMGTTESDISVFGTPDINTSVHWLTSAVSSLHNQYPQSDKISAIWSSVQELDHSTPCAILRIKNALGRLLPTAPPAEYKSIKTAMRHADRAYCSMAQHSPKDMYNSLGKQYPKDLLTNPHDFITASPSFAPYSQNRLWKVVPRCFMKGTRENRSHWTYLKKNVHHHATEKIHITLMGHLVSTQSTSRRCIRCKSVCYPNPQRECPGKASRNTANKIPDIYTDCVTARQRYCKEVEQQDWTPRNYTCVHVGLRLCARLPPHWHRTATFLSLATEGAIAPMWFADGTIRGFTVSAFHGKLHSAVASTNHLPHISVFFKPQVVAHFTCYEEEIQEGRIATVKVIRFSERHEVSDDDMKWIDVTSMLEMVSRVFGPKYNLKSKVLKMLGFCASAGLIADVPKFEAETLPYIMPTLANMQSYLMCVMGQELQHKMNDLYDAAKEYFQIELDEYVRNLNEAANATIHKKSDDIATQWLNSLVTFEDDFRTPSTPIDVKPLSKPKLEPEPSLEPGTHEVLGQRQRRRQRQ